MSELEKLKSQGYDYWMQMESLSVRHREIQMKKAEIDKRIYQIMTEENEKKKQELITKKKA